MTLAIPMLASVTAAGGADFLTPALFNGVGVGALLVLLFWMLSTSKLFTRHQVDLIQQAGERRAESAEKTVATLTASLEHLMESVELQKSMYEALKDGARK